MRDETDESIFAVLKDVAGVSEAGGCAIPLPNASGEMKDHLFVNLTLDNFAQGSDMRELAEGSSGFSG
jgi:hypothetical protein